VHYSLSDFVPSFTLEATRGLNIDDFDIIIEDFGIEMAVNDEIDDLREHLVGVPFIVTDSADADGRQLPGIVIVHLGDGDIEPAADPTNDGLDHLPFPLEGHVFRDAQADPSDADIHVFNLSLAYFRVKQREPERGEGLCLIFFNE
jgi:hypothetical protein